jgi:CHASE3 domain sensor protein
MAPSYRVGRIAWAGLIVTLLAIAVGILLAGLSTQRSIRSVAESTALASAYLELDEALSAGTALERQYRLRPDPALRREYTETTDAMLAALTEIQYDGTAEDRDLSVRIRAAFGPYQQAILAMFDAVDAGDDAQIQYLERYQLNPRACT